MPWTIDESSGYCRSNLGTEVILSNQKLGTYIPALGPFSSVKGEQLISRDIADLVLQVETANTHLLFGSTMQDSERGHKMTFLNTKCLWLPDPSARSHWLFGQQQLEKVLQEWEWTGDYDIKHKSGVNFSIPIKKESGESFCSAVQPMITWNKELSFSPEMWPIKDFAAALHSLGNVANKIVCENADIPFFPSLVCHQSL
jgi:hypothetical protein